MEKLNKFDERTIIQIFKYEKKSNFENFILLHEAKNMSIQDHA